MNNQNLNPAQPGEVRNPFGRPKGSKNRSTIIRQVLELDCTIPEKVRTDLIILFPDLPPTISIEHLGTLIQVHKMIIDKDSRAYERLLDSAYGKATQRVDLEPENNRLKIRDPTPEELELISQLNELIGKNEQSSTN